jgi:hypothetical protein
MADDDSDDDDDGRQLRLEQRGAYDFNSNPIIHPPILPHSLWAEEEGGGESGWVRERERERESCHGHSITACHPESIPSMRNKSKMRVDGHMVGYENTSVFEGLLSIHSIPHHRPSSQGLLVSQSIESFDPPSQKPPHRPKAAAVGKEKKKEIHPTSRLTPPASRFRHAPHGQNTLGLWLRSHSVTLSLNQGQSTRVARYLLLHIHVQKTQTQEKKSTRDLKITQLNFPICKSHSFESVQCVVTDPTGHSYWKREGQRREALRGRRRRREGKRKSPPLGKRKEGEKR